MNKTKALIFGITGQDGAYLAKFLIDKGYEVVGTTRDFLIKNLANLQSVGVANSVSIIPMSISDPNSVLNVITSVTPDEIYNLSGQSSVSLSFQNPIAALESISIGTLNILEAIKSAKLNTKFFNACSSECFGDTELHGADESTSFRPRSPYAIAKASAFWQVEDWRSAYGMFACSGILFNHESPLRAESFVTKKIVNGALKISRGELSHLELGNIEISRDWGWAPDYVDAMWRILQLNEPEDFVIATGKATKLKDFLALVFNHLNLNWEEYVTINPSLSRPLDVNFSKGNPAKALSLLNWHNSKSINEIASAMLIEEDKKIKLGIRNEQNTLV